MVVLRCLLSHFEVGKNDTKVCCQLFFVTQVQHSSWGPVPWKRDGRLEDREREHSGSERGGPPDRQAADGGGQVPLRLRHAGGRHQEQPLVRVCTTSPG